MLRSKQWLFAAAHLGEGGFTRGAKGRGGWGGDDRGGCGQSSAFWPQALHLAWLKLEAKFFFHSIGACFCDASAMKTVTVYGQCVPLRVPLHVPS